MRSNIEGKPQKQHKGVFMQTIPETGFLRLPQVLEVIPVGKTCWWEGVKSGRYPKSVKLSARCTAWKAEDIHALIKRLSSGGGNTDS
jgi:predicted DNA-binding transcriptional regulator AlpA